MISMSFPLTDEKHREPTGRVSSQEYVESQRQQGVGGWGGIWRMWRALWHRKREENLDGRRAGPIIMGLWGALGERGLSKTRVRYRARGESGRSAYMEWRETRARCAERCRNERNNLSREGERQSSWLKATSTIITSYLVLLFHLSSFISAVFSSRVHCCSGDFLQLDFLSFLYC